MSWRVVGSSAIIPDGAFTGERAINVQFYDESNRKLGSQWGASRRITGATNGQKFHSILKAGTLPIDLKAREFTFTGKGIIARFYTGFTRGALPTEEAVYCGRPKFPAFKDFSLYAIATPISPANIGTRWNYDLYLEGNETNQGEGSPSIPAGKGWVIDPGEEVLLEIESLDSQNISATLVLFNGLLDLPR